MAQQRWRFCSCRVEFAKSPVGTAHSRHSDELLKVIRDRFVELGTTHNSVETESGLQLGYLTKVISDPPPKRMGAYIMFLICETLGLQLSVSIAPDFEKRMAHRLERRRLSKKHVCRKARKNRLPPDVLTHRSRLGGIARGRKLSAERLSEIGRHAINERWRRVWEARALSN
jgi:hypothetical protein